LTVVDDAPGFLLVLLRQGPRTWSELAEAGLDRAAVLTAVGEIAASGPTVCVGERIIWLAGHRGDAR